MAEPEKVTVALPENLQAQFEDLRRRLFSLETLFAVGFGISALLLTYFLLFVSDRFWDTPMWLRVCLFGAATLGVVAAGLWWSRLWIFKPRDLRAMAVLVQKRYPRLGDRLLGIVELADEAKRPAYFSPELYRAAIQQVAEESGKFDFTKAADERRTQRQFLVAGALLGIVAIPALILPEASWNSFRRWIAPLAKIPRFTLVELAELPSEQIIPHGEKHALVGKVRYRSFWRPARVRLEIPGGREISARANEGNFVLKVPPQTKDAVVRVRAGDSSQEVRLYAKHRPAMEKASAQIQLPEYLQYPVQAENPQSGLIEVLEGSSLRLEGRTSRALRNAVMQINDGAAESLAVSSNEFSTPMVQVADASELALRWTDTLGLTNTIPWKLAVQTRKDDAPTPEIEELYRDTAILETEVLPIPLRASDDYGVKSIGLNWALVDAEQATNLVSRREVVQEIAAPDTKYIEHTINFSPAVLGVPPESTVEVRAFAVDYLPGRERSESPVYRIHVLGNAKHAEMVRQNLESLLVQLEEITRAEESIASETRQIKELQKLDAAETTQKLSELEQQQQQAAAELQELAAQGMQTMREALRNPAFNEDVLSDWTRNLHQMQKISQQQMKDAAKALKSAAQNPSESGREENLAEAQQKEEEALEALQKMQQVVNEGLDELQALTLAQRLRQLGGQEQRIENTLQVNIPDTIGLTPEELTDRYQRANTQLSGLQAETQSESVKLQSEISRFYERTQKPNYGQVTQQMSEAQTGDELERIKGLIEENIGMEAMDNLELWADRFDAWATLLEPKSEGGSSGSGQGGEGEQDNSALRQLLGLLRMREKQVNIQERTRLLHEHVDEKVAYRDGAILLAASQAKLNRDLNKQAIENTFAMLSEPYNETIDSLNGVEALLDRPQTDQVTRSAQDQGIANLTDLINLLNEQAKRNSPSSGSRQGEGESGEQMAFLMQMMGQQPGQGMQPGRNPGGSMAGGTTDKPGEGGEGESAGREGEERAVRKSSGIPQNYPTEFRDALEKYYKALEQSR